VVTNETFETMAKLKCLGRILTNMDVKLLRKEHGLRVFQNRMLRRII
jgi:hypothetical protein